MAPLSRKDREIAARAVVESLGPTVVKLNAACPGAARSLDEWRIPSSVGPLSKQTDWRIGFDTKAWTLAILPHIQIWPGYAIRDSSGRCFGPVVRFIDQNAIGETDIVSGASANKPRKGKYHVSISIPTNANQELKLARELTAKNGTIAILTALTWTNKMIIGPSEVPDIYVLDGEFPKTLAWFVWNWNNRNRDYGTWRRLPKVK